MYFRSTNVPHFWLPYYCIPFLVLVLHDYRASFPLVPFRISTPFIWLAYVPPPVPRIVRRILGGHLGVRV